MRVDSSSFHVKGGYDDGTTEMLPGSEVKYAVNQKNGLSVSANGTIAGVKSGDYMLTVSSAGVSSPVKVKVYSKWKTKAYPAANPGKLTDIKGHKALPAIEWALQAGIMTEAGKGLFKPEAAVSEAEFWTMLLKAYKINIEAYRPAASKHWADTAYLIAKERNFPLSGLTNPYARDSRITRLKIAEIIAAADGLNYKGNDAVKLVLGKDYVRCETELSLAGYQGRRRLHVLKLPRFFIICVLSLVNCGGGRLVQRQHPVCRSFLPRKCILSRLLLKTGPSLRNSTKIIHSR